MDAGQISSTVDLSAGNSVPAREALMNVAKRLQDLEVLDPNGRSVRLGDAWDERTVVLAFIRHFG